MPTAEEIDVAIVGAGIVGIAVASHLQDEGRRVVLLDRGDVAKGASFGNAGGFAFAEILPLASPGILRQAPGWLLDPLGPLSVPPAYLPRIAPWLLRFFLASRSARYEAGTRALTALNRLAREETHRLVAAAGLEHMVRVEGTLDLYEDEATFAAARHEWDAKRAMGLDFEVLEGSAIAAIQPGLSPHLTKAVFTPLGETVSDPYDYAVALAARVENRGGQIRRAAVEHVAPMDNGARLEASDGAVLQARTVVLCAGAWSKQLAGQLGDRVPLETERGYNTTLPTDAFDLRLQLYFGGHGFVVTPLSSGIRVGGAVELGGLHAAPNYKRADAMLEKAKRFMPELKTAGGRPWMGFRPSMPDSLPVIGRSRASPNVLYAFGHGHLGLTQSAATGRLVADLAAGRQPAIDLSPFSPQRFSRR